MRLLIVGTLDGHITTAGKIAMERGAKVTAADTVEAALAALRGGQGADLLMIDVSLDVEGLCTCLKSERIHVPVVACGIGTDTPAAVRAIKAGAKEYVPLPPNAELIAAVLLAVAAEADAIVSSDPALTRVLAMAEQIAPSDASVLITGESGTGKELMARHIHKKSRRSKAAFISVNCAAIPENLLESELFGHEKGAFTGAVARRIGKFEEADGGTLLLDEISGDGSPGCRPSCCARFRSGSSTVWAARKPVCLSTSACIATSNRDLSKMPSEREGVFREDLLYRPERGEPAACRPCANGPRDIERAGRSTSSRNTPPPMACRHRRHVGRRGWPG